MTLRFRRTSARAGVRRVFTIFLFILWIHGRKMAQGNDLRSFLGAAELTAADYKRRETLLYIPKVSVMVISCPLLRNP